MKEPPSAPQPPAHAVTITRTSVLPIDRAALWEVVGTMDGVNAELMPLIRMTSPKEARGFRIEDAPLGQVAFKSWLLLGGLLPVDLHALRLFEVHPGHGFVESSTSWLQSLWRHERTLQDTPEGCRITDTVTFVPRLGLAAPLTRLIVGAVFSHRHRRLQNRHA